MEHDTGLWVRHPAHHYSRGFEHEHIVRTSDFMGPDTSTDGQKDGRLSTAIRTGIAGVHYFGAPTIFTEP